MTLVEWLTAILDEDERVARAASPGPWRTNAEQDEVLAVDDITVCDGFALSNNQVRNTVRHIALHDPAAVLADIAAKRAIIARVADDAALAEQPLRAQRASDMEWYLISMARDTLRLLASGYAHRDGFDPSWV
jgi:hypothetical protein